MPLLFCSRNFSRNVVIVRHDSAVQPAVAPPSSFALNIRLVSYHDSWSKYWQYDSWGSKSPYNVNLPSVKEGSKAVVLQLLLPVYVAPYSQHEQPFFKRTQNVLCSFTQIHLKVGFWCMNGYRDIPGHCWNSFKWKVSRNICLNMVTRRKF